MEGEGHPPVPPLTHIPERMLEAASWQRIEFQM